MTDLINIVDKQISKIKSQLPDRAKRVSIELRNAELKVNSGPRSGRLYKRGGKMHQASAPGEPPAVDTGTFRSSWRPQTVASGNRYISKIISTNMVGKMNQADMLEGGTPGGQMAPRPYADKVLERAKKKAVTIYKKKYL